MPNDFPATRESALLRLAEFEKMASRYSRDRNHVVPGHGNVSRLSPAIRYRLISETEVAKYVLKRYAFSTVQKFLQEVYWRRYWKSWLSLRPQVWDDYRRDLLILEPCEVVRKVMAGEGEIDLMNDFSRELVETGYLHNHARMWFAGYWIHTLGLPWQLGADFFFRHLLDADAASNTLSWRWVAGLQTKGKTYLARRSNIEKYLHSDLLAGREGGLELLSEYRRQEPGDFVLPEIQMPDVEAGKPDPALVSGFWMHSDDLSVEPQCHEVFLSEDQPNHEVKARWLGRALDDTESRMAGHRVERGPLCGLPAWAAREKLSQVIACRPEVGLVNDELPSVKKALMEAGVRLVLMSRREDEELRPLATAGFFSFWKEIEARIRGLKDDGLSL